VTAASDPDRWTAVDRYLADRLLAPDAMLDQALEASAAAGLPAHGVSRTQGALLELLARIQGARTILELGTLGAYSTIWLARALPPDGRLVTLELEAGYAEVARANLAHARLADVAGVRVGPARDTLAALVAEGHDPFELVFIDADKASNAEYLAAALEISRPGTLIVAANVIRGGSVIDGDDANAVGVRRFFDVIAADPRLRATAIQTVGEKGYDGFALAGGPLGGLGGQRRGGRAGLRSLRRGAAQQRGHEDRGEDDADRRGGEGHAHGGQLGDGGREQEPHAVASSGRRLEQAHDPTLVLVGRPLLDGLDDRHEVEAVAQPADEAAQRADRQRRCQRHHHVADTHRPGGQGDASHNGERAPEPDED
jgi:predicted O-methyltransferase YrrM